MPPSLVPPGSSVHGHLLREDVSQLQQQSGFEHSVRIDLPFHLLVFIMSLFHAVFCVELGIPATVNIVEDLHGHENVGHPRPHLVDVLQVLHHLLQLLCEPRLALGLEVRHNYSDLRNSRVSSFYRESQLYLSNILYGSF